MCRSLTGCRGPTGSRPSDRRRAAPEDLAHLKPGGGAQIGRRVCRVTLRKNVPGLDRTARRCLSHEAAETQGKGSVLVTKQRKNRAKAVSWSRRQWKHRAKAVPNQQRAGAHQLERTAPPGQQEEPHPIAQRRRATMATRVSQSNNGNTCLTCPTGAPTRRRPSPPARRPRPPGTPPVQPKR